MSKSTIVRSTLAVVAGFAITACIIQEQQPQPQPAYGGGRGDAYGQQGGALVDGDYSCTLNTGGTQYPAFRCVVYTAEDGARVLEKLGGSQRVVGRVQQTGQGFRFDGEFHCPQGSCDEQTSAEFVADGGQSFRGELSSKYGPSTMVLTYMPGGFTYGGQPGGEAEQAPPPDAPPGS